MLGVRPGRDASFSKPAIPKARNRLRQRAALCAVIPNSTAMSLSCFPAAAKVKRVIQKTTREKPAHRTHWSTRSMAAAVSLSEATVRRIWHKNGLKPHLVETFKVSTDPHFA